MRRHQPQRVLRVALAATVAMLVCAPAAAAAKGGGGKTGGSSGGGSTTTLTTEGDGVRSNCSPINQSPFQDRAWNDTAPRCQASGSTVWGTRVFLATAPFKPESELGFPLEAQADTYAARKAQHVLAAPANYVTYTWTLPFQYRDTQSVVDGTSVLRTTFTATARHTGCECVATTRRVLLGSDSPQGAGTWRDLRGSMTPRVSVTLRNPSGQALPPGTVEVRGVFDTLSKFTPDSAQLKWRGFTYQSVDSTDADSLTATTG